MAERNMGEGRREIERSLWERSGVRSSGSSCDIVELLVSGIGSSGAERIADYTEAAKNFCGQVRRCRVERIVGFESLCAGRNEAARPCNTPQDPCSTTCVDGRCATETPASRWRRDRSTQLDVHHGAMPLHDRGELAREGRQSPLQCRLESATIMAHSRRLARFDPAPGVAGLTT